MTRQPTPAILTGVNEAPGDSYSLTQTTGPIGATELTPAIVERVKLMLAEVHNLDTIKDIRDKAEALRQYAKQAGDSWEAQNHAAEIKVWSERRGGELLRELERGEPSRLRDDDGMFTVDSMMESTVSPYRSALTESDIAPTTAHRWQLLATIPEEVFSETISSVWESEQLKDITTNLMLRKAQEIKRQQKAGGLESQPLPEGKFRIFYADPPWAYGNSGVITGDDNYGRAERHYPAMSIAELCALGLEIKAMADDDAVLFLWVTSPLLAECFEVIKAWGFQYKTSFVWDKVRHNFGHYNSVRHELLLVCTRGSCLPDVPTLHDSVVSIERSDKHSEKPEEFRQMIDGLYAWGNRLELFARCQVDGWEAWGNE